MVGGVLAHYGVDLAVGDRDPERVASLSEALMSALIDYSDTARPELESVD
jgi:hypothetical protein